MNLEINNDVLVKLGLDPDREHQIIPTTVRDIVIAKVNTALEGSYDLFTDGSQNRSNSRLYVPEKFPNDNAFILTDLSFHHDARFQALGNASTLQTEEYFRRYSFLRLSQDNSELMSFNYEEYSRINRAVEDGSYLTGIKEWPWVGMPHPLYIGKREQIRFSFEPAPGLTTQNIAADIPYLRTAFNDNTSSGFTVFEVKMRGVKFVQR